MEYEAYSRAELLTISDRLPERGPLCRGCGARISIFADLSEADEHRVRNCIREGRNVVAMDELRAATGCPIRWANLWVLHEGRLKPVKDPTPCPFCSKALRTSQAIRCRFCRKDWHDPKE
jgi:hypothetical protein